MRFAALIVAGLLCGVSGVSAKDLDKAIPAAKFDPADNSASQTVVLAGGCFWGQQGLFEHVKGVTKVVAGYSGDTRETATYDQVSSQETRHAESIEISFDPKQVSLGRLLQIYFSVAHDPTQVGGQGPDEGSSYRSAIFAKGEQQAKVASAYIDQLTAAHVFAAPLTTKIEPFKGFYRAESEHQDFLVRNPKHPYIVYVDLPKLKSFRAVWPQYYRDSPVLLSSR